MRGNNFKRRVTTPDPLYNSKQVTKFINGIMRDGKRSIAAKLVYDAFEIIEKDHSKNPLTIFETALSNVGPKMEVRPRRVGGASYQVPVEVRGNRREALAIRWLIESANKRSNKEYKCFEKKLAAELLDAAENQGNAIKKREDVLRAAEANKAFAHFRW